MIGGRFSLRMVMTTARMRITANKKLDSFPKNTRRQSLIAKKEKKMARVIKTSAAVYQERGRSGTRYSGTCHFRRFKLFSAIFLIDKGGYILYSDYNIKIKKWRGG